MDKKTKQEMYDTGNYICVGRATDERNEHHSTEWSVKDWYNQNASENYFEQERITQQTQQGSCVRERIQIIR